MHAHVGFSCPMQASLEQKETKATKRRKPSLKRRPDSEVSELDIKRNAFEGDWNDETLFHCFGIYDASTDATSDADSTYSRVLRGQGFSYKSLIHRPLW